MKNSLLTIIPARGGSKSIPRKNLALLGGRPLISYTLDICKSIDHIGPVLVSTDDEDIADYVDGVDPQHYSKWKIEPIKFIMQNQLDFCEGNVVKYVMRWRDKNGIADLKKARQYIDFLIKYEQENSL